MFVLQIGVAAAQPAFERQPATSSKATGAVAGLCTALTPMPARALATTLYGPTGKSDVGVTCHVPSTFAVVVSTMLQLIVTVTETPGTAVPAKVGRGTFVTVHGAGDVIVGAASAHELLLQVAPAGQLAVDKHRTHTPSAGRH